MSKLNLCSHSITHFHVSASVCSTVPAFHATGFLEGAALEAAKEAYTTAVIKKEKKGKAIRNQLNYCSANGIKMADAFRPPRSHHVSVHVP